MFGRTVLTGTMFLLLLSKPALGTATDWYVDGSLPSSGGGQTWGAAFKTIQEAIDAASDGDTVTVRRGTYYENVRFEGKNIALQSLDPLDRECVANTIIDGNNQAGPVVTFSGAETEACVLSGVTIRNGRATTGGGICGGTRDNHTHAAIRNNNITANSGSGLAYCNGIIKNNTITNNSAELGGGLVDCGGLIQENDISYNTASSSGYGRTYGGGLARCQALIQRNTISHNHAGEGGGLYRCDRTICNNSITANWVSFDGGGLADCDALVRNNMIADNYASYGGGLSNCEGTIDSNTIAGNDGGGLLECDGTVQNNIIFRNVSDKACGGGLDYCDGTIQNNLIVGNDVGLRFCDAVIRNNTIAGNRAWRDSGGLLGCTGTITNCIIWANEGADGRQIDDWNEPTHSCIQNWTGGGEGNIAQDPRFVDPDGADDDPDTYEDNDYRLMPDSPCIDAGYNAFDLAATDISGMRRIMYGGKNLGVDMGAYEYYINEVHPGPGTGEATLSWSSVRGSMYVILYSEDLSTWILAEGAVPSSGDKTTSWTDDGSKTGIPPSLAPRRFYRILENP